MIYLLGLICGRRFRVWYWRTHGHRWHWGIVRCVDEIPVKSPFEVRDRLDDFMKGLMK